jgi:hypothetical protein
VEVGYRGAFVIGDIPYHWRTIDRHDLMEKLEYTAASSYVWGTLFFIAGSLLFFLGGVFNYWRAYVVMKE